MTTFIIPSIDRPTLQRAMGSCIGQALCLVKIDTQRIGEGLIRNQLIEEAKTEWVSMLDDDDTITPDYVERLKEEIKLHPKADCIIFREYFLHGVVLPAYPIVAKGNIPISFSVRRDVALELPFKTEPHEDYEFVKRLHEAGKHIVFSPYLTYRMRH